MVDLGAYVFKYLNTRKIKTEESFTDDYFKEVYKSEHVRNANKQLHIILDVKYEKETLHKVMETQCQHLTVAQRNDLLQRLQKIEDFLDGTLGTWKPDSLDFKLKEDENPICLQPYPVPKVHKEIFKKGGLPFQMIQNGEPHPLFNLNLNQIDYVF